MDSILDVMLEHSAEHYFKAFGHSPPRLGRAQSPWAAVEEVVVTRALLGWSYLVTLQGNGDAHVGQSGQHWSPVTNQKVN